MDVAFGWVALVVIPIVLAVSVVLAVLLARGDQSD
jgi:preprotein translocase subunit SecG